MTTLLKLGFGCEWVENKMIHSGMGADFHRSPEVTLHLTKAKAADSNTGTKKIILEAY